MGAQRIQPQPESDRLNKTEFFLCAVAAVALHALLAVLFCKEQNIPVEPESHSRTTILFSEEDPHFAAVAQKIKAAPDPAEFIRGNRYGYSKYSSIQSDPGPEFKNDLPAAHAAEKNKTDPMKIENIPAERSYADLRGYTASAQMKQKSAMEVKNTAEVYPIWRDAFGSIDIRNAFEGYNSTIRINSQDVTAPTILKIQFSSAKSTEKVPVHITLLQSCGDTFLDHFAQKTLQNRITDPAFIKKFNPEYNDRVSIYWQPELNAVDENAFPQNMFPGGDKL